MVLTKQIIHAVKFMFFSSDRFPRRIKFLESFRGLLFFSLVVYRTRKTLDEFSSMEQAVLEIPDMSPSHLKTGSGLLRISPCFSFVAC